MIKSKSLSEKGFNQITNHLVKENKQIQNKENGKKIINSYIKDENKTLSLKKEKKLENKLISEKKNQNKKTISKDKTSTDSHSPLSSTRKGKNYLNSSISSNKKNSTIKIYNTINNSINNNNYHSNNNNNNKIKTPNKKTVKEIKVLFLRNNNNNENEKRKDILFSSLKKNPIKKNKTSNLINLRKSFGKKIKTPLKKRKLSDYSDSNSKMNLTNTINNNKLLEKYYLDRTSEIIKELEEPINFKNDIDIVSSTTFSLNSSNLNENIDLLNSNNSFTNNEYSFNKKVNNNNLSGRNKKGKSLSMCKSNNLNHNLTISNLKRFSGLIPNKIKTNFKANLTLTTIKETNFIDNHHYEKNTVSTLNKKVKFKQIKNTNQSYKIKNEDNEEKNKNLIHKIKTSKNQNNNTFTIMNNTFDNQMNNSLNNSIKIKNKINNCFIGKIENYTLGKELGKGCFAVVRLGINKINKKKYAIKIYSKISLFDNQKKTIIKNEISILKKINHENIMKMYEVIDTPNNLYLVLEYINGISLLQYIKNTPEHKINEKKCKILFYQIVKGINYCQLKNICHRDIKLENILLLDNSNIKIIDFGFGIITNKNTYHKFFCGTPSYMAPEVINKEKYIAQFYDIWSLGILLYTMLCGFFPFFGSNEKELFEKINDGNYDLPNFISDKGKKLIKKILVFKPKDRPSTEEILLDEWFEDL